MEVDSSSSSSLITTINPDLNEFINTFLINYSSIVHKAMEHTVEENINNDSGLHQMIIEKLYIPMVATREKYQRNTFKFPNEEVAEKILFIPGDICATYYQLIFTNIMLTRGFFITRKEEYDDIFCYKFLESCGLPFVMTLNTKTIDDAKTIIFTGLSKIKKR